MSGHTIALFDRGVRVVAGGDSGTHVKKDLAIGARKKFDYIDLDDDGKVCIDCCWCESISIL